MKTIVIALFTAIAVILGSTSSSNAEEAERSRGPMLPRVDEPTGKLLTAVESPKDERIRHLSWPKIVTTGNDTLVLAYSAGVGHNAGGSGPAVSISNDSGRTFTSPQLLRYFPADDDRYRDCGNLAMGLADDGAVVLLAMAYRGDEANTIIGWRSTDDGRTWKPIDTTKLADNQTGSVYGHVLQVPGKGLVVFGHYRKPGSPSSGIWMSTSADDGRTWGEPQTVTNQAYFEPAVTFAGGKLIGLFRLPDKAGRYDLAVSDDLGESWQVRPSGIEIPEGLPGYQPSPFVTVSDADPTRLYALQSIRGRDGDTRGRVYLWTADTETLDWKQDRAVVSIPADAERLSDWSYPWMTPLGEGKWILAFYAGASRGPNSIYTVTWGLDPPTRDGSRSK